MQKGLFGAVGRDGDVRGHRQEDHSERNRKQFQVCEGVQEQDEFLRLQGVLQ